MAVDTLEPVLDRLAAFNSESAPVLSLYLDLRPDQHGRRHYRLFLDDAFQELIGPSETGSLRRDVQRIEAYLAHEPQPSVQTLAIFSSSGEPALFETLELDAPIDGSRLYIDREPHLFPLARLSDQYARYAALLVNTNAARLYVFAVGAMQRKLTMQSEKGKRVSVGAWSQRRYQRHVDNLAFKHMKNVAAAVERVVREDRVERVIVAADAVALPLLKEQLSQAVRDRLVEVGHLDMKSPEHEVLRASFEAFREADAASDGEVVDEVLAAHRSGGLGAVGAESVRRALQLGQVDRLLVPAAPAGPVAAQRSPEVEASVRKDQQSGLDEPTLEELVAMARRTDATVTFIEDGRLLDPARGIAARLRFRA